MESRRSAVACLGLSAVAVAVAWRRYWIGDKSPFRSDIEFYHHPTTHELASAWSQGRIPLWTDRIYGGFPFFADPQAAAWYPGTALVVALGPHAGYVAFLMIHAWIAAAGGFAWLRSHGVGAPAALAAGLTIPLSGFFVYETQHPGLFAILCWVPAWLAATHRLFRRPGPGRLAVAALPLALMVFAGTLQVLFGVAVLYACYVAGLAFEARVAGEPARALRGLVAVLGAQILGLSLAAVVLIPAFAHLPHTARALGMEYGLASIGSVHPVQLLGLFVNRAETLLAVGATIDFEGASLYVGTLALPLALLGIASAPRFLAAAVGLGLATLSLLALGHHGGLHPLLYDALPGVTGSLRGMGRATGPLVVAIALLVGFGIQAASEIRRRRALIALLVAMLVVHVAVHVSSTASADPRWLGPLAVSLGALALCALGARRPAWVRPGLAALVAFDLLGLGALDDVVEKSPPPPGARQRAGMLRLPLLAELPADRGRVVLLGPVGGDNFTYLHGLDGLTGYNPLVMLQYVDFVARVDTGTRFPRAPLAGYIHDEVPTRVDSGLFDAAAVRFLISREPLLASGLRLAKRSWNPVTRSRMLLYEPEDPMPRTYLSHRTRRARSEDDLDRLLGGDFDPRQTTVFEGEIPELDGPPGATPVETTRSRPEHLVFDLETHASAMLVVADSWYPGWVASVDGEGAPVLRVNGSFRGVPLGAGARRVEMRFEPGTFRAGAALSLAAAAVLAALGGSSMFRRTSRI